MSSKNEMTAVYSQLAPEFIVFLECEQGKLQKQIDRMKKPEAAQQDAPELNSEEKHEAEPSVARDEKREAEREPVGEPTLLESDSSASADSWSETDPLEMDAPDETAVQVAAPSAGEPGLES